MFRYHETANSQQLYLRNVFFFLDYYSIGQENDLKSFIYNKQL